MMAIFNPETHPTISRDELVPLRMAPRLDSLDNKTIYLVDVGFAGGKEFLEELQAWFSQKYAFRQNGVARQERHSVFGQS